MSMQPGPRAAADMPEEADLDEETAEPEAELAPSPPDEEAAPGSLAQGVEVIKAHLGHAPSGPGVYRMIDRKSTRLNSSHT